MSVIKSGDTIVATIGVVRSREVLPQAEAVPGPRRLQQAGNDVDGNVFYIGPDAIVPVTIVGVEDEPMSEISLGGSCLCGAVQYKISGEAQRFYHCHCSRCRKSSGTGHASNLLVTPLSSLTWLEGEDLLQRYKVPEAERFYTCFCSRCGSAMPRVVPELDGVLIAAGSLDGEPPMQPQARIFWDSRAAWSCSGDDLPTYAEYPTK